MKNLLYIILFSTMFSTFVQSATPKKKSPNQNTTEAEIKAWCLEVSQLPSEEIERQVQQKCSRQLLPMGYFGNYGNSPADLYRQLCEASYFAAIHSIQISSKKENSHKQDLKP